MSGRSLQSRPFKEVNVEPLWSELGRNRFEGSPVPNFNNPQPQLFFEPEDDESSASVGDEYEIWQSAPTVANWRLNLIALSQTDNLLFVACGDKVHVTVPLNVRQTLPSQPDLILRLPRSRLGQQTTGYIDPFHPHCVNHLMVSMLGDFEILLLCCDDGDVMAYYTRSIAAEMQHTERVRQALPRQKIMVSHVQPFFHENVGISAWGLAIHQQSRLIAISSNRKEVTVFAFALHESPIPDKLPLSDKETFPLLSPRTVKPHDGRNQNYKRILRLYRMGHNIPSIAFANDAHGAAKYVMAMDILGTLWQLNIWDLDDINYEPYRSQSEGRTDRPMGWGVLVLPVSLFKRTRTPAEALGMPLSEEPYGCRSPTDLSVPFDISDSVRHVRQSSQWHPMFGPTIRQPDISEAEQREATATTGLILQEDSSDEDANSHSDDWVHKNFSKKVSDLAVMELDPDDSEAEAELIFANNDDDDVEYATYPTSSDHEAFIDVTMVSENSESDPPTSSTQAITPNRDRRIVRHELEQDLFHPHSSRKTTNTETANKDGTGNFLDPDSEEDIILFKLIVNWPLNLPIPKYDPGIMITEYHRAIYNGEDPFVTPQVAKERWSKYYMPDGSAIMRIFQNHIDLQPPTKHMHHTVCKKLLKQRIPEDVLFQLQHIDRLSIHAVIAELSLVVVASQVGRVALVTLTRPEDSWSTNGPVTLFRVDMFLPFRRQEDEGLRPVVPLLGMTVGPMQSKAMMIHKSEASNMPGSRRATGSGADSRKRWRLMLHYYDHTVLTYEISRKDDGLIVL